MIDEFELLKHSCADCGWNFRVIRGKRGRPILMKGPGHCSKVGLKIPMKALHKHNCIQWVPRRCQLSEECEQYREARCDLRANQNLTCASYTRKCLGLPDKAQEVGT